MWRTGGAKGRVRERKGTPEFDREQRSGLVGYKYPRVQSMGCVACCAPIETRMILQRRTQS